MNHARPLCRQIRGPPPPPPLSNKSVSNSSDDIDKPSADIKQMENPNSNPLSSLPLHVKKKLDLTVLGNISGLKCLKSESIITGDPEKAAKIEDALQNLYSLLTSIHDSNDNIQDSIRAEDYTLAARLTSIRGQQREAVARNLAEAKREFASEEGCMDVLTVTGAAATLATNPGNARYYQICDALLKEYSKLDEKDPLRRDMAEGIVDAMELFGGVFRRPEGEPMSRSLAVQEAQGRLKQIAKPKRATGIGDNNVVFSRGAAFFGDGDKFDEDSFHSDMLDSDGDESSLGESGEECTARAWKEAMRRRVDKRKQDANRARRLRRRQSEMAAPRRRRQPARKKRQRRIKEEEAEGHKNGGGCLALPPYHLADEARPPSEYEQYRLEKIRRNEAKLAELGLLQQIKHEEDAML